MLYELINDLLNAETPEEKEQAYKRLAQIGMDRMTANIVAEELKRGQHTVVEVCPHCEHEIEMVWDTSKQGFAAHCPVCGNRMMLCDECLHKCDGDCDWNSKTESCKHSISQ